MPLLSLLAGTVTQIRPMLIGTALAAALAVTGYAYHTIVVLKKDHEISELKTQIQTLTNDVNTLKVNQAQFEAAAKFNEDTIAKLQTRLTEQAHKAQSLTQTIQRLERDKQQYLSIFREHDLTKLARAKPGLIENRVNSGTVELFRQLERDTQK